MRKKIVFIGAGSMRFASEIIVDLCLSPGLSGSEVVLVDPDAERLASAQAFAVQYAQELGVDLQFSSQTDRRHALHDAHFVICAALAGGRKAVEQDRVLLEQHGYYRGIGMNTPHRQLMLMLAIARDMAEVCPNAWHIMAANPVPESCSLIDKETGIKTVGICHGHLGYIQFASLLGLDPGLVACTAVGINHSIWAYRFTHQGNDLYPLIDEWIREVAPTFYRHWTKRARNADYQISSIALDLYHLYGLLPLGDSCRAITPETWWYHSNLQTKQAWYGPSGGRDGEIGHQNTLNYLQSRIENLLQAVSAMQAKVTTTFPPKPSQWQVIPIIDSIANDRPSIQQVSIKNNGAITELPDDCFVEVPALCDHTGFHVQETYQLPDLLLQGVLQPRQLLCDRIVSATRTRDIRFLLQTFLSDHKTTSYDQAVAALSALVTADENMHDHYKGTLSLLHEGVCSWSRGMELNALSIQG